MDLMLDLETMGDGKDAAIVAIGAVYFDADGPKEKKFYRTVSLKTSMENGGTVSASTILWWLRQSKEASNEFVFAKESMEDALVEFEQFIDNKNTCTVWGNGANFDNVILRATYERWGNMPAPWRWYNDRCYRTLKNMFPEISPSEQANDKHNALSDAYWQAEHASRIFKYVRDFPKVKTVVLDDNGEVAK